MILLQFLGGGKEKFEETTRRLVEEMSYESGCKKKGSRCCCVY